MNIFSTAPKREYQKVMTAAGQFALGAESHELITIPGLIEFLVAISESRSTQEEASDAHFTIASNITAASQAKFVQI